MDTTAPALGSVLVATDFTAPANDATARAAWLPLARGATISLMHVLPERPPPLMRGAAETLLRSAETLVQAERERSRQPPVDVFTTIEVGSPAERIAERARDERVEVVIVGRGQPHGAGERLLGTMAERIVRACDCSVLVVAAAPATPYCRPLVAVDLSPLARRSIEMTLELAPVSAMSLLLAHTPPSSVVFNTVALSPEMLRGWAGEEEARAHHQVERWIGENADLPVQLRAQVRRGEIASTILTEAETERADLIVIGTRGHSALVHLALGAIAERVLRHASRDILAVR